MTSRGTLLASALDSHTTEVAVIDAAGDIVYTNDAWREFGEQNGLPAADMLGVNYLAAVDAADDEHAVQAAAGVQDLLDGTRETLELEYPCHSPDEQRWFQMWASSFEYEGDEYVIVEHLDITDRVLAEQTIEQQNDQLETVTKILSHDLRNPLTVALGQAQFVAEDNPAADPDALLSALERIQDIIADALVLARDDTDIEREPVSLQSVAEAAWGTVDTRDASLEVAESLTVEGDASLLRNVFENLFQNAIDHGGPDVTVRIGATQDGFYIEDTGPGIAPERLEHVFDVGHSGGGSTGFGLAIAQQIIEMHGWEIAAVENEAGARFEVSSIEAVVECPA